MYLNVAIVTLHLIVLSYEHMGMPLPFLVVAVQFSLQLFPIDSSAQSNQGGFMVSLPSKTNASGVFSISSLTELIQFSHLIHLCCLM
ncbi:hypothetical protein ACJX0J_035852, partial [Zea mays]